jgi:hypothetical protein
MGGGTGNAAGGHSSAEETWDDEPTKETTRGVMPPKNEGRSLNVVLKMSQLGAAGEVSEGDLATAVTLF